MYNIDINIKNIYILSVTTGCVNSSKVDYHFLKLDICCITEGYVQGIVSYFQVKPNLQKSYKKLTKKTLKIKLMPLPFPSFKMHAICFYFVTHASFFSHYLFIRMILVFYSRQMC